LLGLVCEHLGVLPSELGKRHPTLGDIQFLAGYYGVKQERENEKMRAMFGRR